MAGSASSRRHDSQNPGSRREHLAGGRRATGRHAHTRLPHTMLSIRGVRNGEGLGFGDQAMRTVPYHPPEGHCPGDLHESAAQAAPGLAPN